MHFKSTIHFPFQDGDGEGKVASSQYARVRMRKALRERLEVSPAPEGK